MENFCKEKYYNIKDSKLLQLPDYIIGNYIFPYITSKELFYTVRKVHPYLHDALKLSWLNIMQSEMINQIIIIEKMNIRDELKEKYEKKLVHLMNFRNFLIFYNMNSDILESLKLCIDYINNDNVIKLIVIFTEIFFENNLMETLLDDNLREDYKKNTLLNLLNNEETQNEYSIRLTVLFDINNVSDIENALFDGLKILLIDIDEENIDNINQSCSTLNSFCHYLFKFQEIKRDIYSMKIELDELNNRIEKKSSTYNKKFYEMGYKILINSKSSNEKFIWMNNLFNYYLIKSPLYEYKIEISNLENNHQKEIECLKIKLMEKMKEDDYTDINNIMKEMKEIILEYIINKRNLLTKKFNITEKFFDFLYENKILVQQYNKDTLCKINNKKIKLNILLKCLMIDSQKNLSEIQIANIEKIFIDNESNINNLFNIDKENNFSKNKINDENNKDIQYLSKNNEIIEKLKEKTLQMFELIKIFNISQEKYISEKEKYKKLLYLLNKEYLNNGEEITIERLGELIKTENIQLFKENEISNEELKNIENLEINETLIKNIQNILIKRINKFFEIEKIITKGIFDKNIY